MRNDSAPAVYGSNINGDICMTDTYFATCKIGLESVVAGELRDLGIEVLRVSDARVDFAGDHFAMARACLWLRTAERVLMKLASFRAVTFDSLEGLPAAHKFYPCERQICKKQSFFRFPTVKALRKKRLWIRFRVNTDLKFCRKTADA